MEESGLSIWKILLNDNSFSITSNVPIVKNSEDGLSWSINDTQIRMNVDTPDECPTMEKY